MAAVSLMSHRRHEEGDLRGSGNYDAKPEKGWGWVRRSLRYVLHEQRLWCVVLGVLLTTAFFVLQPSYGFQYGFLKKEPVYTGATTFGSEGYDLGHRRATEDVTLHAKQGMEITSPGAKVPLGLKKGAKRIVVTGGAGFVGSHLVDRLMARGDSVIVVDNFFTGKKENVMHHFGNPRFELIRHDVVEPLLLEVDQIYHLACPASPVHYKFNPVKTIISSCNCPCLWSDEVLQFATYILRMQTSLWQGCWFLVIFHTLCVLLEDASEDCVLIWFQACLWFQCKKACLSFSKFLSGDVLDSLSQDQCGGHPEYVGSGKACGRSFLADEH